MSFINHFSNEDNGMYGEKKRGKDIVRAELKRARNNLETLKLRLDNWPCKESEIFIKLAAEKVAYLENMLGEI